MGKNSRYSGTGGWGVENDLLMEHRNQLPRMLNDLGLNGIGVEIGVCEGVFSDIILKTWKGKKLYLIDSWRHIPGAIDFLNTDNNGQLDAMAKTFMKVYDYGSKAVLIRESSVDASKLFIDESLDFCYIDASHDYKNVMDDLNTWYPKVKPGGIISGHDYVDGLFQYTGGYVLMEVKRAVDEFFKDKNVAISYTKEDIAETLNSWYLIKSIKI